jgi:hypothetical protein
LAAEPQPSGADSRGGQQGQALSTRRESATTINPCGMADNNKCALTQAKPNKKKKKKNIA